MAETAIQVLVVDDEPPVRRALASLLAGHGHAVAEAGDGEAALRRLAEHPADIVITDLDMPRLPGMGLLAALREQGADVPVIVVTAAADLSSAVAAMRAGASDYLTKPVDFEALQLAIEGVLEHRKLRLENENLRRHVREQAGEGLGGLIGAGPAMQCVYRLARQVAPARATVLITGESGTGKGELARAIHALSPRADKPFVAVHCAALAETLLESELFGHERGSFTGAEKRRAGRFEQAHEGTLFLDEIGEVPPATQIKLLTVLQERRFERVGGNEPIHVDVRIIAATNRDLGADVAAGRFREDLFYRLNVVRIEMPPLRLRGSDAVILAGHFLERFAAENRKAIRGFTDSARAALRAYHWPGNVRELENAIERAVVLCEDDLIGTGHLPTPRADTPVHDGIAIPGATMAELERYAILTTLGAVGGSTARAAEILGISVRTIQYRLQEYAKAKEKRSEGLGDS